MVGEWGVFNRTPHDVVLRWAEDCLANWQKAGWGWAMWNFRGSMGVMDSDRSDIRYENFEGHKLDRKLMDLLQRDSRRGTMATISQALAIAIQHHQAGRLQAAEQIYRQILEAEPNQADAMHLLGVIAHQVGRHEAAVDYIRRAIALQGSAAVFHHNLGEAYLALRQIPRSGCLLPPGPGTAARLCRGAQQPGPWRCRNKASWAKRWPAGGGRWN